MDTVVRFSPIANASENRSFDFAGFYGAGIDAITLAFQTQIQRFLCTHDGNRSVITVVGYCRGGGKEFLNFCRLLASTKDRSLSLRDIDRNLVDGYINHIRAKGCKRKAQYNLYTGAKAILVALHARGLLKPTKTGDDALFPDNPFPNINHSSQGARPLSRAERKAFTTAVTTAVAPLLRADAQPTNELLSFAVLLIALRTGRNTTPLLQMETDCLRPHPKAGVKFLVLYKRRAHKIDRVPVRVGHIVDDVLPVSIGVSKLIEHVKNVTADLRVDAPSHLRDRLWLFRARAGYGFVRRSSVRALGHSSLNAAAELLVRRYALEDLRGVPLRINVSRLRKTFANRIYEILDGDLAATAVALGNEPAVLGRNYLRPGEHATRNWMFMGKVLTRELLSNTLGASEKTPVGHCSDTKMGEFAPRDGATCMRFLDCFRCRNYVVTGDDLHRLFSFYFLIARVRDQVGKQRWKRNYGHILRVIDNAIIKVGLKDKIFSQAQVGSARERARIEPHPYWARADVLEVMQ